MVQTIGKQNEMVAILLTIGNRNIDEKIEQTIQITNGFGIPAPTVYNLYCHKHFLSINVSKYIGDLNTQLVWYLNVKQLVV